jgi:uncharacterized protein YggE
MAIALTIASVGGPAAAGAQTAPAATLTVTGQGEISRAPDLATVAVAIGTNDDDATRALSENNRRFAALSGQLATLGIAATDITSTSIQSYFNPRGTTQDAGQVFGFVVTRDVQINVTAFAQLGAVVDAATTAGAGRINGVVYGFRDRHLVDRAALAAAVADAYAQAQVIASAAHVHIVRVLRIANEPSAGPAMPLALSLRRTAEAPVPTTISPSDLAVSASISITYLIR